MGRGIMRQMALFMIVLVITIPFYTSSVFAQTARVIRTSGADDVPGYRKANDYTKIVSEITPAAGDTFSSTDGRVHFLPSGYPRVFDSCEESDGAYRCTWTSAGTWTTDSLDGGTYQYEVWAKPTRGLCEGIPGCRQVTRVTVDSVPARVVRMSAEPRASNGGPITVSYDVEDTLGEGASGCAGIGQVEVYYDRESIATQDVEGTECRVSGTIEIDTSGAENGNNTLCVFVRDKLGQEDTSVETLERNCISVPKDDTDPEAIEFDVRDATASTPLGFTRPGETPATVWALVRTSPLFGPKDRVIHAGLATVASDIPLRCVPYDPPEEETEEDSPDSGSLGLSEEEPTAGPIPDMWECRTPATFNINLPGSASLELSLTIEDEAGNTHTAAKTVNFEIDSDKPLVEAIVSQATYDGKSYLGATNNTLSVLITEMTSGFAANNVRIRTPAGEKQAECLQGGEEATWICSVSGISAAGSTGAHVPVSVSGADDSGQPLDGGRSVTMIIDKDAPEIMHVEIINAGPENPNKGFFTTGDTMLVRVHIDELAGMQSKFSETSAAFLDAGQVTGLTEQISAAECGIYEGEDHWTCAWEVNGFEAKALSLRFQLADMLGNKARLTDWIDVFHVTMAEGDAEERTMPDQAVTIIESGEEAGEFWNIQLPLNPSPPRVDKTTTGIFGHTVWYELNLIRKAGSNIKPASVYTDQSLCEGDDVTNYMESVYVISPEPDGMAHHLKITLKRVEYEKSELEFKCQLEIITIKDGRATAPQYINITAPVHMFAEEDVSERLHNHIQSEIDGFIGDTEFIKYLNIIVKILQGLCNIVFVIQSIADVLNTIDVILYACKDNQFCKPAYEVVKELNKAFQEITKDSAWLWIKDEFCGYVTCRKTLWGGYWQTTANNAFGDALSGIGGGLGDTGDVSIFSGGTEQAQAERRSGRSLFGGGQLWPNPSDSLIMSIATGCLPGVVTNVQKLRNMRCKYISCLMNNVPIGMPVASCSEAYSYSMCMFVWGEVFNVIPGAQFVQQLQGQIFDSISSWSGLVGTAVGLVCTIFAATDPIDDICRVISLPGRVVEIYQDVEAMVDTSYWGFDEADLCTAVIEQWNEENAEDEGDEEGDGEDSGENRPGSSPSSPTTDGGEEGGGEA